LGYYMSFDFGQSAGSSDFAKIIDPRLITNFKFFENNEKNRSYNFTDGYVKYSIAPYDDMSLSLQLGREKIKYGLGYTNSLLISGNAPDFDFLKFNFNWGIARFSSIHGAMLGPFSYIKDSTYTKYIALNRLSLHFKDLFDLGVGESEVYYGRFDLGYLTPLSFYKYIELANQDRDKAAFIFDIQTHFIKGIELQGTFYMNEDILFNLGELGSFINKTGYQLGIFAYEPFGLRNLTAVLEYTKIRPYVYSSSTTNKINYTNYNTLFGNPIGPNADQIYFKVGYNFNENISAYADCSFTRKGKNIYDSNGNIIKNVGGDEWLAYRYDIDAFEAPFLDGERINTTLLTLGFQVEPVRDIKFDFFYKYRMDKNLTKNLLTDIGYGAMKMTIDF